MADGDSVAREFGEGKTRALSQPRLTGTGSNRVFSNPWPEWQVCARIKAVITVRIYLLLTYKHSAADCRTPHSRTSSSSCGHVDLTTLPLENFSITQHPLLQTSKVPSPLHPLTIVPWQTQQVRKLQQLQMTSLHNLQVLPATAADVALQSTCESDPNIARNNVHS